MEPQKKIAIINDFCGFGRCSLAVSIPIISAMKIQCCSVPTAVFSNHTGYDDFFSYDLSPHLEEYISKWEKIDPEFDGILSGFLGSPEQIETVKYFLKRFRRKNTVTTVDPVMGDDGKLYKSYSAVLAGKMKELMSFADIITPNLTEACILTDTPYFADANGDLLYEICKKLSSMGPEKIVISGINRGDDLENFIYEKGNAPIVIREHKVGACRSGTGDVFSSVIAADAVNGVNFVDSVRHASSFVAKALRRTAEMCAPHTDGVCFEEVLSEL